MRPLVFGATKTFLDEKKKKVRYRATRRSKVPGRCMIYSISLAKIDSLFVPQMRGRGSMAGNRFKRCLIQLTLSKSMGSSQIQSNMIEGIMEQ